MRRGIDAVCQAAGPDAAILVQRLQLTPDRPVYHLWVLSSFVDNAG